MRAYEEWFAGYKDHPRDYLKRTFEETGGYDEVVVLRDIRFESHCEHHMAPIIGRVHIGYLPRNRVVGISKLARLVEVYARRLQIQEKMTAEIATCLDEVLKPHGVAVVTEATHQCMTTRGVHKTGVSMVTSRMLGVFRDHAETRQEFLAAIGMRGAINVANGGGDSSALRRAAHFVGQRPVGQRLGDDARGRSCRRRRDRRACARRAARDDSRAPTAASRRRLRADSESPLKSGRATSSSTAPETAALLRRCGNPIAA